MAGQDTLVAKYARLGAAIRRQQLLDELQIIYRAFPDLRSPQRASALTKTGSGSRRSWTLSADQRKAISDRMKKTWAARRRQAGKKAE